MLMIDKNCMLSTIGMIFVETRAPWPAAAQNNCSYCKNYCKEYDDGEYNASNGGSVK